MYVLHAGLHRDMMAEERLCVDFAVRGFHIYENMEFRNCLWSFVDGAILRITAY